SRQADLSSKKRRKTSVREPMECKIKIRVIRIERYTLDDSNKVIRPQVIRQLMINDARKAYRPPAIVVAVKDVASEQGLEELNPYVGRREITNIQASVRSSELTRLIGDRNLEKLREMDYQVDRFDTGKSYQGFCFVDHWQLINSESVDGSHSSIPLTRLTDMIDDYSLSTCETAMVLGTIGLKIIRRLQPKWEPRYSM
ncbi:hypothetical protein BGZ80_005354, partial [Entomortierella chlamydospora]